MNLSHGVMGCVSLSHVKTYHRTSPMGCVSLSSSPDLCLPHQISLSGSSLRRRSHGVDLAVQSTTLQSKYQHASRSHTGAPAPKAINFTLPLGIIGSRRPLKGKNWGLCLSVANSDQVAADTDEKGAGNAEKSLSDDQFSAVNPSSLDSSAGISQFQTSSVDGLGAQTPEASNGSRVSSDMKQDTLSSPDVQSTQKSSPLTGKEKLRDVQATRKRTPLTAREKLRAARVLSRYTESKASKSERGSTVLDALRESDRGKKRSGLPEAPTNLLDDSKRGMPKQGLTFDFPGGFDLFLIAFSFVFISTVMFATTFIVWKVGAIHFNEY